MPSPRSIVVWAFAIGLLGALWQIRNGLTVTRISGDISDWQSDAPFLLTSNVSNATFTRVSPATRKSQAHLKALSLNQTTVAYNKSESTVPSLKRSTPLETQGGLTVLISTFRQPGCLQQYIQYIRTCPVVTQVRVNWFESEFEAPPDPWSSAFLPPIPFNSSWAPIQFDVLPNRLSHRFLPRDFLTEAVFHVDVDTLYSCRALQFAYDEWQLQNGTAALGFHPKFLRKNGKYATGASFGKPFRYNMLFLTKGGIAHRNVLEIFFDPKYQAKRNFVDAALTAEDMLMGFALAQHNISMIPLCVDEHDTCVITCSENDVAPLVARTSNKRQELLATWFHEFGRNSLKDFSGVQNMQWLNATVRSWNHRCYSNPPGSESIAVARPTCKWFCENTPVCPRNLNERVKRKLAKRAAKAAAEAANTTV